MAEERLLIQLSEGDLARMIREEITSAVAAIAPKEQPAPSRILRVTDICQLTGYARSTVYQLCFYNRIPHRRGAKFLYFDELEVKAWMESDQGLKQGNN